MAEKKMFTVTMYGFTDEAENPREALKKAVALMDEPESLMYEVYDHETKQLFSFDGVDDEEPIELKESCLKYH